MRLSFFWSLIKNIIRHNIRKLRDIWLELEIMGFLFVKEEKETISKIDPGSIPSGAIELIQKIFERRYIFLPDRAYASLFASFLSFTLIFMYTSEPPYSVLFYLPAYGFLIYFVIHAFSEIFLKRADRDLEQIKKGAMTSIQIEVALRKHAHKNPQKIIETVDDLVEKGDFKNEGIQLSLFNKYEQHPTILVRYIKGLLLKEDFTPKALKLYLSKTQYINLPDDFLKKLVDKYKELDSFLFNLGRYGNYQFDNDSTEKRYYIAGYEFQKKAIWINRFFGLFYLLLIILMYIFIVSTFFSLKDIDIKTTMFSLIAVLAIIPIMFGVEYIHYSVLKKKIRDVLKNKDIELGDIELERFVREVTRFNYRPFF